MRYEGVFDGVCLGRTGSAATRVGVLQRAASILVAHTDHHGASHNNRNFFTGRGFTGLGYRMSQKLPGATSSHTSDTMHCMHGRCHPHHCIYTAIPSTTSRLQQHFKCSRCACSVVPRRWAARGPSVLHPDHSAFEFRLPRHHLRPMAPLMLTTASRASRCACCLNANVLQDILVRDFH